MVVMLWAYLHGDCLMIRLSVYSDHDIDGYKFRVSVLIILRTFLII